MQRRVPYAPHVCACGVRRGFGHKLPHPPASQPRAPSHARGASKEAMPHGVQWRP
eukprot:CAMPEP_0198240040 /NCGR_PEP_ID=MMETSP1446-20131203/5272_1 /TAXON_ID=1461542 ORGANISM="Unidentified sp, Strain CCMP2111" /NCGR_SAMPLE_ID=MMETSP1446 /ASSEMBLY_ACC=CAM_ASM_001112 /LENGTH=54 /DNA_ID=CAMNT_0043922719 /DNA_START=1117 /DNA_END=1278 /DNA_ORIENTATION=+